MAQIAKSCAECGSKCCSSGPGPRRVVKPRRYLNTFGDPAAYRTQCEGLTHRGQCRYWNTSDLPVECRNFVCQHREFSRGELETISQVNEIPCPKCHAQWMIRLPKPGRYWYECECCGTLLKWKKNVEVCSA